MNTGSVREPSNPSGGSGWKDLLPIARLFEQSGTESLRGDVIGGKEITERVSPRVFRWPPIRWLATTPEGMEQRLT